ncbi:MAG: glycosyltransferase family 4 protein [Planctomycetes bacterium]|nr:glycosyltransferase family 4 protein [Planctomycetota bacterium]
MRVLVWQPVYVLGGGLHVLRQMVEAFSRQPAIDSVTLAVNRKYAASALEPLAICRHLKIVRIDAGAPLWPHADHNDVAYVPWPHGTPHHAAPIPKVCVYQDTILLDAIGSHATREFLEGMARGLKETIEFYDQMIVTSNYTRRRVLETVGSFFADRVSVLPLMATEPTGTAAPVSAAGKAKFPWGVRPPFFVYPGNVSEHKNQVTLLQALSRRRRRDVPVVFCGYGTEQIGAAGLAEQPHVNRINRLIRDRGLVAGKDFVSLGYVDDATASTLLHAAAALVMPTRAEGMGLPIHEAIDAGVPVICSDIEVLREHYDGRSDAIRWVDPECPSEIAAALDEVADHADELRSVAAANRGCDRTWDDIATATVAVFRHAIDGFTAAPQGSAPHQASSPPPAVRRRWYGSGKFRGPRRFFKKIGFLRRIARSMARP